MVTPATTGDQPVTGAPVQVTAQPETQTPEQIRAGGPAPEVVREPQRTPISDVQASSPAELAALRRELSDLRTAKQGTEIETYLRREASQAHREALERGMTEEDARWVAQRHYGVTRQAIERQQNIVARQEFRLGQQNAARQIGAQYGVDPRFLIRANTPDEMHAIAQREKAFSETQGRLKTLEQSRVPAQTFNQPGGSTAGNVVATNANIDKLWLDWEIAHSSQPGQVNPYEAQYRKLVRG